MKRKIAAIVAADIAGYSRLISEDEEDTLRRLKGHRKVYDGLVEQYGGRIFNTAGDAVLSEFPSSVEAVRCAIEIQESLRRLNRAYQPSRHMNFRIGISLGDVVERDGDLLGDGVNIAARLEGLAEPGGICIARSVHEQVAAKLSIVFTDIGPQTVKNIPQPIHAFTLSLGEQPAAIVLAKAAAAIPSKALNAPAAAVIPAGRPGRGLVAALGLLLIVGAGGFYVVLRQPVKPAGEPQVVGDALPDDNWATSVIEFSGAGRANTTLEPDKIPYVSEMDQDIVGRAYMPAADQKALAISNFGGMGMATGKPTEDSATAAALESCQAASPNRPCFLFAIGNRVVSKSGSPPLPPTPWINTDERLHQPFDAMKLPFLIQSNKERLRDAYSKAKSPKAVAISAIGNYQTHSNQKSVSEAVRRVLESCGGRAGIACRIVAIDDKLVVPLPATHRPNGFFDAWTSPSIAAEARPLLAAKIAISERGWTAVAVGADAVPGLATGADTEDAAVKEALDACGRLTTQCRILAIGPFTVAPN